MDLTLPDYATLAARAGIDPDQEQRRVAAADPEGIGAVARSFRTASQGFATTRTQGTRAASTVGVSFQNDGAAVYGVDQHAAALPADLPSASTRLETSSGELTKVATDLGATRSETAASVRGLFDELTRTRRAWAARVAGAGLLTPEQAAAWTAERDRLAGEMAARVGEVGHQVSGRIQDYEGVVRRALGLFADQGFAGSADLTAPAPPAPRPDRGADPTGFGLPVTAGLAADPVNTALGNFVEVETDVAFGGLLAGLTVARTYNSRSDRVGESPRARPRSPAPSRPGQGSCSPATRRSRRRSTEPCRTSSGPGWRARDSSAFGGSRSWPRTSSTPDSSWHGIPTSTTRSSGSTRNRAPAML